MVVRGPEVVWESIDGEVVILSPQGSKYHVLNTTASYIWGLIGDGISVSAICNSLTQSYGIDSGRCQSEVIRHLEELADLGLVALTLPEQPS